MSWMQTASGVAFDLLNPTAAMVKIEDIAHHLARINRFTGATREPYSVAQHSVLVARVIEREFPGTDLPIGGLLHDSHEAYIGDISTPLKDLLGRPKINRISGEIDLAVAEALIGDQWDRCLMIHPAVKNADLRMLATEKRDLLEPSEREWEWTKGVDPYDFKITPWGVEDSERAFLEMFHKLTAKEEATCR